MLSFACAHRVETRSPRRAWPTTRTGSRPIRPTRPEVDRTRNVRSRRQIELQFLQARDRPPQSRPTRPSRTRTLPVRIAPWPGGYRRIGELATRRRRSREFTHRLLQQRPRLVAVLVFPFGVKTGRAKLIAKWRRIGPIKIEPFCRQVLLQRRIELGNVIALFETGRVDMLGDDGADVIRQAFPCTPIGH